MKAPQTRSTPIQVGETTRIQNSNDAFIVQTKYRSGRYQNWIVLDEQGSVKLFRDIVQYTLASFSDDISMPERYTENKTLTERERAFTEQSALFVRDVYHSETVEKLNISVSEDAQLLATMDAIGDESTPAPIWIGATSELETLLDACSAWLTHHTE